MTDIYVAPVSVDVVMRTECARSFGSATQLVRWSAPVAGIRMSNPASRTATSTVATSKMRLIAAHATTVAYGYATNVANGATAKDTTGDEAFEDPV
jgi:hypothetical protein